MRVIEKGRRVDAQLVQCHIEKSKNPANDKYAVDYHWTDRQGVVQSVNGQKVPGKEVYVKICYGKLAPFGILVLDDEPALQPVIEVSKEVLSKGNFWGRAGTGLLLLFATLLGLTYTQIDQRKQRDES